MFKHDLNYTTPWFIDGLFEQEKANRFFKANNIGQGVCPSISHQKHTNLAGVSCFKKVADKGFGYHPHQILLMIKLNLFVIK